MPLNDDRGDRLVRISAAYTEKVNAAVQAGRESLAYELAEQTFAEEVSGADPAERASVRLTAGRRAAPRTRGTRPPTALGRLTRRSLGRFGR